MVRGLGPLLVIALLLVPACGFSSNGATGTDTDTADDTGADTTGMGTGGGPDAGPTDECMGSGQGDCPDGQVCEPVSKTCQEPTASCEDNSECSGGTYCESETSSCLPSSTGTPCDGPDNCADGECIAGMCGCDAVVNERTLTGSPLDIFLMLDRSGSMISGGGDCAYDARVPTPPEDTKGCYATYALADYAINQVTAEDDVRVAFDVMSLHDDCTGSEHDDPEQDLTALPVAESSDLIKEINDVDFRGGFGTQIEGALRGIVSYTGNPGNVTDGRQMIGVFITDGEPTECERDPDVLDDILSAHLAATGVKTFIIGMTGSDDQFLEQLAIAGGAEAHTDFCGSIAPPCHYFNVGDGNGAVLRDALAAISQQAVDIPCEVDVSNLQAPDGEDVDYFQVNVTFNDGGSTQLIGQVPDVGSCPSDGTLAWYYDDPGAPTTILLCDAACTAVTDAGDGANLAVVAGCTGTVVIE